MSLPIYVDAYSGYRANERPVRFWMDAYLRDDCLTGIYEIEEVEDRWFEPAAAYFRVRTREGKRYLLRYDERRDSWSLQAGWDAMELLTGPGIEFVTVSPKSIRAAESRIAGCERCRGDEADQLFDSILADVLGKHGAFEFVMSEPANCPNCKAELTEETLIEPQGGLRLKCMLRDTLRMQKHFRWP